MYNSRNLINWPLIKTIKQFFVDIIIVTIVLIVTSILKIVQISFIGWIIMAVEVSVLALLTSIIVNFVFYKEDMFKLVYTIVRRLNINRESGINVKSLFIGKTLMITRGTGTFRNVVLNRFLKTDIGEICVFSRDEKKQDDMRHDF